jgi:hypothetical protein
MLALEAETTFFSLKSTERLALAATEKVEMTKNRK